jgi:glutathione S-transferase
MTESANEHYRVIGGNGSPYSVKMRAIMRYRRLPHLWVLRTPEVQKEVAHVRPQLLPTVQYPDDGGYHVDSTYIALALEERHPGMRSILPDDPADRFLCLLLEDMADEWLTKAMFHYRWDKPLDQDYCSRWIINDARPDLTGDAYEQAVKDIRDRQVGRLPLVGCTPENAPIIEQGYHEVLAILKNLLGNGRYMFGTRPSLADFGWFGQLKTLADDSSPMAIMRREAQIVADWVRQTDDASGIEGEWRSGEAPEALRRLLTIAGDVYLPFLAANAAARDRGDEYFSMEIYDKPYTQATFRYQVKCLGWLRSEFATLDSAARDAVTAILGDTKGFSALR